MGLTMRNRFDGARASVPKALISVVAAALLLTIVSVSGPRAGATPTYKYYSSAAAPLQAYVGVATPVAVTLKNSTTSNQSFGSAEITIGAVPASDVTLGTNSGGWSQSVVSTNPAVVLLKSGGLPPIAPGGTLTVNVTITPPDTNSINLGTVVKQSNDFSGTGNNFTRTGADPVITVSPVTLSFSQEPGPVQQSTRISTSYMCPPVSVATSPPASGLSVSLGYVGSNPGLIGTTSTLTDGSGVATFGTADCTTSGLGATNLGSGYTLSANSPGAASAVTSTPFDVVQFYGTCPQLTCSTGSLTSPSTGTTGNVGVTFGATDEKLLGSFGQGELQCDNLVTTIPGDPIVAKAVGGAAYGTVTMTFPKAVVNNLANNGTPLMQVCAGASAPFQGSNTTALSNATYPYQGLLADCPSAYLGQPGLLCVVSRSKNAANETIVVYASDLSDPSFW